MQLVESTIPDLNNEDIPDLEPLMKAARTCVNTAVLSLNIISALHDQNLVGT